MAKRFFIVALVVLAFATCALADFRKDEDPTWIIFADTAYTLRGGEWNIDLTGAISYGIIDGLHVWTHLILWACQIPNLQVKRNVVLESGAMPALTIAGTIGSYGYKDTSAGVNVNLLIWNLSAYISKKLNDNLWISGSYTYDKFNASGSVGSSSLGDLMTTWTGSSDVPGVSNASAGIVYQISPGARLCLEVLGLMNIVNNTFYSSYSANPGVTWAFGDAFRLKLFIITSFGAEMHYVPCVNLAWKIK